MVEMEKDHMEPCFHFVLAFLIWLSFEGCIINFLKSMPEPFSPFSSHLNIFVGPGYEF